MMNTSLIFYLNNPSQQKLQQFFIELQKINCFYEVIANNKYFVRVVLSKTAIPILLPIFLKNEIQLGNVASNAINLLYIQINSIILTPEQFCKLFSVGGDKTNISFVITLLEDDKPVNLIKSNLGDFFGINCSLGREPHSVSQSTLNIVFKLLERNLNANV
jgi:hypothetical protein